MIPLLLSSVLRPNSSNSSETIDDEIFKVRLEIDKERKQNPSTSRSLFVKHGSNGRREHHVKRILEHLTQKKFVSIRPQWLKNPKTNRNLEIDCYCEALNVAVEIDGEQHHHFIPWFHKTYETYLKQKENDLIKTKLLRDRGVKLIRIPYSVKTSGLEEFIIQKLFN
jgi:very-short-patch-repair endonuclease